MNHQPDRMPYRTGVETMRGGRGGEEDPVPPLKMFIVARTKLHPGIIERLQLPCLLLSADSLPRAGIREFQTLRCSCRNQSIRV